MSLRVTLWSTHTLCAPTAPWKLFILTITTLPIPLHRPYRYHLIRLVYARGTALCLVQRLRMQAAHATIHGTCTVLRCSLALHLHLITRQVRYHPEVIV